MNSTSMRTALVMFQRQQLSNGRTRILGAVSVLPGNHSYYSTNSNSKRTFPSATTSAFVKSSSEVTKSLLMGISNATTLSNPFFFQASYKSTTGTASSSSGTNTNTTVVPRKEDEENDKKSATVSTTTTTTATTVSTTENKLDILGLSTLIPEWKKMFSPTTLMADVSAGLTVGCIAVPLSLAIAVASGVPPEVGLVTAAVSGVAGGLLGGTTLAVTGPAAAISLLVVGAVQQHGLEALPFITLACGGLQLASGVTRLGVVAKLVPVSVIAGFTTGVGTLILTGQLPKALGMAAPAGMNPVELLGYIGQHISSINPEAAGLALGTAAAMYSLPKIHAKMPSALLAVGGATLATHGLGLDVSVIGSIPSGLEAFQLGLPVLPSADALPSLSATVLLIYAMTSVESLLSCAALEKMKKTGYKHNPDQELIGQGLANAASGLFMGMPVTSVIARSSLNVRCNAQTRLPALVQAGFVFGSVVAFSDSIAMIPMPALSGMLIMTGMGMLNPTEFQHCYHVQKMDAVPFATTIAGMLSLGLAEGIGIGCASAVALNLAKAYQTNEGQALMKIQEITYNEEEEEYVSSSSASATTKMPHANGLLMPARSLHTLADVCPRANSVWKIDGPITFMSMLKIDQMVKKVQERSLHTRAPESVVLDMQGVTDVEFTGVEELVMRCHELDIPVQMRNVPANLDSALDLCDPNREIERRLAVTPSS